MPLRIPQHLHVPDDTSTPTKTITSAARSPATALVRRTILSSGETVVWDETTVLSDGETVTCSPTGPSGASSTIGGGSGSGSSGANSSGSAGSGSGDSSSSGSSGGASTSGTGGGSGSGTSGTDTSSGATLPPGSSSTSTGGGSSASGISGSDGGDVYGTHSHHTLSPAAITAILLGALLVISVLAIAGRLLWQRRQERRGSAHVAGVARSGSDPSSMIQSANANSATHFVHDPLVAARLRGGLAAPDSGAGTSLVGSAGHSGSGDSLPREYRIEPFTLPVVHRPPHARTDSTMRLLDDTDNMNPGGLLTAFPAPLVATSPAAAAAARPEKRPPIQPRRGSSSLSYTQSPTMLEVPSALPAPTRPRSPPRGAMRLPQQGASFNFLTPSLGGTPQPTPMSEGDSVLELPPTYASLTQPRSVRRWFQFWPRNDQPPPTGGTGV